MYRVLSIIPSSSCLYVAKATQREEEFDLGTIIFKVGMALSSSLKLAKTSLLNIAGVFSPNLEFSEEKIELTFATNFLGHYLLTEMLIEKMIDTAKKSGIEGQIINLTFSDSYLGLA
ncbi:unnamed protein product [Eruca vesicaria subsp. sativa]|uniref:Uncharacterized protein n=1 Tax=Eruca vesicaria subsp. sativa TaxID=29727 RepID=A0ABC8IQ88_ERUVS|nr:unnamed protein product [Eruca vesicaria subsp. sativa]